MKTSPNIYRYYQLADFLKDFVLFKRQQNARWSLGVWAKKLGIQGSGTLSNFIAGRRVPRPEIIEKIKKDIQFSEYEEVYFDALVTSSLKGVNQHLKKVAVDSLMSLQSGRDYKELVVNDFEIIADPLSMVLREAVKLEGFKLDSDWIIPRLLLIDVTPKRIKTVFQSLLAIGLLKWEQDRLVQTDLYYKTPADTSDEKQYEYSMALKKYYTEGLRLNGEAIFKISPEKRHYNSITFCCDPEQLEELKSLVHDFCRKTLERHDRPSGKMVYQLHVQLLPQMDLEQSVP